MYGKKRHDFYQGCAALALPGPRPLVSIVTSSKVARALNREPFVAFQLKES